MRGMCSRLAILGLLLGTCPVPATRGDDASDLAFFEQKIRPVLVKECYSCHSAGSKAVKGGLKLDSRAGLLRGGDTGPAIVPGKPDESLLLDALRHDGLAMPPKNKLPEAVAADFARWIEEGAIDPRIETAATRPKTGIDLEAGRRFWAYQPPHRHDPPENRDATWAANRVDRFLLAGLEAKGLKPAAGADKPALIRRLYFDLIGLPPTPEEVDRFAADPAPDAYPRLVDRLLATPQFAERWGRHWLDVARFGESLTLRGLILKDAWRYRDYVIQAFESDLPYDQFVREQVAGDLLEPKDLADRRRKLVATSFLVLGNTNLEEQDKKQLEMDVVDEQIDTLSKAFLAQTVSCARCHDHKFDPIPTRDYYALAGILKNTKSLEHANVSKWLENPLPAPPEEEATLIAHERAVAQLEGRIKAENAKLAAMGKEAFVAGVIATKDVPGIVVDDAQARKVGDWQESKHSKHYIGSGYIHDQNEGKGRKTLTFQPDIPEAGPYEVWLAYSPGEGRSKKVPLTVFSADGEKNLAIDMRRDPPLEGRFVSLGTHRFEKSGQGFVLIANEGTSGHVTADTVVFRPASLNAAKPKSPAAHAALQAMEAELKRLKKDGPRRETFVGVEERPKVEEIRVHVRGSVHNLGESAPRGFLRVASEGDPPSMPDAESGRRELAGWIASEANPLTARVFVNRAWHWLFGAGLVRTVDNFGTTGELPSNRELLDDLAVEFMADGWSMKRLIRRIVTSHAYQLSAVASRESTEADPENRLLGRASRRRLDAECLRDAMLSIGGKLLLDRGGPTFPESLSADYGFLGETPRRSVYVPIFRNALPEIFEVFDFADPSMVVGRRDVSTVAPQALLMMNHPFVIEQARASADRLLRQSPHLDEPGRIRRAYRLTLARAPTVAEVAILEAFLREDRSSPEAAWATIFQSLFASAEFRTLE